MKLRRTHPVNIIENISGYFWLLLLPLIRGLLAFRGGIWGWLSGVWFDLLVLGAIFGLAMLRWACVRYCCTEEGVAVAQGVLVHKRFSVPYREIATLSVSNHWFYRPFRVTRLHVDSNAGSAWKYDFSLTLSNSAAEEILSRATRTVIPDPQTGRKSYRSSGMYVALLAFVSSRTVAGVVFTAAVVAQVGRILGNEIETTLLQGLTDVAKNLAFGIPPIAVFLALLIVLGWLISFGINLSRNYRFTVTRTGGGLQIHSGFFSKYRHLLNANKVNFVESTQSIFTKWFHIHSLFLHCAGYGKSNNELAVLFPAIKQDRVNEIVGNIVGGLQFTERTVYPSKRSAFRFFVLPLCMIALIAAATIIAGEWLPRFGDLIRFMGGMLELPMLWWVLARLISFFHTGVSRDSDVLTLRFSKRFGFHTVAVQRDHIVKLAVRQSLWQMMSGVCNVTVWLYSEGKKRYTIPALPLKETCGLFQVELPEPPPVYGKLPFFGSRILKRYHKAKEQIQDVK